jgi:hypothetical protein
MRIAEGLTTPMSTRWCQPVPAEGLVSALAKQLRKAAQIHVAAAHDDAHALTLKLLTGLNGRCQ